MITCTYEGGMIVMIKEKKYYDPYPVITKQRPISFVIGARSMGKTYGYKLFLMKQAIKHNKKFVYLRRTMTEMESVIDFFGSIIEDVFFEGYVFAHIGRSLMYAVRKEDSDEKYFKSDWIEMGRMYGLTEERKIRSDEYHNYRYLLYDEWLPEFKSGFLKNEPGRLMAIAHSIFRDRDFQIFCLANSSVLYNPYFTHFDVAPNVFKEFTITDLVVVQIVPSDRFYEQHSQTMIGRLIEGSQYAKLALSNDFKDNDSTLVEDKTRQSKNIAVFSIQNENIGVWYDDYTNMIYMSELYNDSIKQKFGFYPDDYNEENSNYREVFNSGVFDKLVTARRNNSIRYTSIRAKVIANEALSKIRIF